MDASDLTNLLTAAIYLLLTTRVDLSCSTRSSTWDEQHMTTQYRCEQQTQEHDDPQVSLRLLVVQTPEKNMVMLGSDSLRGQFYALNVLAAIQRLRMASDRLSNRLLLQCICRCRPGAHIRSGC